MFMLRSSAGLRPPAAPAFRSLSCSPLPLSLWLPVAGLGACAQVSRCAPAMHQGSRRHTQQFIIAALALAGRLCCSVHACTVLELSSSTGFAANVLRIFHTLPVFEGFNGTFFVDEGDFRFKCKQARLLLPFPRLLSSVICVGVPAATALCHKREGFQALVLLDCAVAAAGWRAAGLLGYGRPHPGVDARG